MCNTGVLSFINTINYGAELQALALVRVIHDLGHEVELINYESAAIKSNETPCLPTFSDLLHPRNYINALINYPELKRRSICFKRFEDKFRAIGAPVSDANEILAKYHNVVVGSDQVWCPAITNNDITFLVPGERRSGQKVISYAASFGDKGLPDELKRVFSDNLFRFDALSVRENSGVDTLNELELKDAVVSIDPTLLLSKLNWMEYTEKRVRPRKYVFAYSVSESRDTIAFAKRAAIELNADLLYIKCYGGKPVFEAKSLGDSSPGEFLDLIMNAELVVTSSFHGLCFSILFNRQFRYVISGDKGKSRLHNLVSELGLGRYGVENRDLSDYIDFTKVNKKLLAMREGSLAYLKNSLS